jgi:hypothetical protein
MACQQCREPLEAEAFVELPKCGHFIHLACIVCPEEDSKVPAWFDIKTRGRALWPTAAVIESYLKSVRLLDQQQQQPLAFTTPVDALDRITQIPAYAVMSELP